MYMSLYLHLRKAHRPTFQGVWYQPHMGHSILNVASSLEIRLPRKAMALPQSLYFLRWAHVEYTGHRRLASVSKIYTDVVLFL